jgi:hypothetical protein
MLQQYYDGFTVNNLVMTNDNPLLIIDSRSNDDIKEEEKLRTLQEGNFIVDDVNKQYYFVTNNR